MSRLALGLAVLAVAAGCRALPAGTERHRLEHDGRTRRFLVHLPPGYSPRQHFRGPIPVVLVLHGAGGTGKQMERMSGFSELADREDFIAVYPDGIRRVWNDGRRAAETSRRGAVDDTGFLLAVLDALDLEHLRDVDRTYATGISNGGFMCYRLANDHAERFAAIAPVVTGMSYEVANAFGPSAPVAVYAIQGTADPLIPFHGGDIGFESGRADRGQLLGTLQTVERWRAHNGCDADAIREDLADAAPLDGCTVVRETWGGGAAGTAVRLDTIEGGGHTWPGGPQYLPKLVIGPVCRDYEASEAIWEFFVAHGRRSGSLTPPDGDH